MLFDGRNAVAIHVDRQHEPPDCGRETRENRTEYHSLERGHGIRTSVRHNGCIIRMSRRPVLRWREILCRKMPTYHLTQRAPIHQVVPRHVVRIRGSTLILALIQFAGHASPIHTVGNTTSRLAEPWSARPSTSDKCASIAADGPWSSPLQVMVVPAVVLQPWEGMCRVTCLVHYETPIPMS